MGALTVQQWLAKVGAAYVASDPFATTYKTIATADNPAKAPAGNPALIEACLRYRGLIYWKKNPGDCGKATKVSSANLGTAVKISEASLGSVSALSTAGIIGLSAGVSAGLGVATLGVGLAAAPILAITQHHAQAVSTEQGTLCSIANAANSTIPSIDAAVVSGQIGASTAIQYMITLCENLRQGLDSIKKDCNAACVYQSILQAHMDFAQVFYPAIANNSLAITTPGQSSASYPASTGAAIFTPTTSNVSPTGAQGLAALMNPPPTSQYDTWWIWAAAALLAVLVLFLRKGA